METKESKQLTREEIEAKRYQFDFDKLLDPYREGGTENQPVRRTMGTILDYLLNKKKYSLDIVGAAILSIFIRMNNEGLKFEGDGTYGSPGAQLVTNIRVACDKLVHAKLKGALYEQIARGRMDEMKTFIENQQLVTIAPLVTRAWYQKLPFSKYRKWRKKIKAHIKTLQEPENVAT